MSSPSPTKSRDSGFRNAIRIRRNSGTSSTSQSQQHRQHHIHHPHAHAHPDIGPFEMQVVERAVRDEQEELDAAQSFQAGRRGSAPEATANPTEGASRPQYTRKSSLLEQLVREDKQNSSSSGSSKPPLTSANSSQTTGAQPSFSRLNSTRSRDVTASNDASGLGILHEGDENNDATATQGSGVSSPSRRGSGLTTTTSAPAYGRPTASRPQMIHSGPSSDQLKGLAPGPRLAAPDTHKNHPNTDHSATSSEQSTQDGEGEVQEAPATENASKPGIFSSLMRRGRSYTLPPLTRNTTADRPHEPKEGSASPQPNASQPPVDDEEDDDVHEDGVVDYLDVVDAEVGVLNHMSNIQNSIFIPHIPGLYNRQTTHALPANSQSNSAAANRVAARRRSRVSQDSGAQMEEGRAGAASRQSQAAASTSSGTQEGGTKPGMLTRMTSAMSFTGGRKKDPEAAQHFSKWADMDEKERHELDEHVQFLLSRPQKFRRGLRGFGKWAMTPMGFIMLSYGIAITGWGIVIMLFIWKWIDLNDPSRQRWWIEICDQVLCALFAAVGLGFAPFRAVDTWRMCHIAHFHHLSWKRRKQFNLPKLPDPNDLPRPKGYNEAFPPPGPLDLITEEEGSEVLSPRSTTRGGGSHFNLSGNASGPSLGEDHRSSREDSDYEDRTPGQAVTSPGSRSRSSTTTVNSSRPSATAQAISNANPPNSHRWWHVRSKKEKEQHRQAAEAAMQAVDSVSPNASSQAVNQEQGEQMSNLSEKTQSAKDKTSNGPPQSRPQLRGQNGEAAPPLQRNMSIMSELEKEREDVVVLTPEEQAKLNHHQRKFHQSHTFYRYHETATHRAFPLDLMIVIVCLLDCHSLLQGSLGGVTWGINYHHRPTALTASLITCSLSCNAVAGFLIYLGGRKTKKREEVTRRLRIALEEEAYREILLEHKRRDEEEEMGRIMQTNGGIGNGTGGGHSTRNARLAAAIAPHRKQNQNGSRIVERKPHPSQDSTRGESPTGSTRALL